MNLNTDKFEAAILYVCSVCVDARKLNTTNLHKILWLSDFLAFNNFGEPLTKETYKKNKHGPFAVHLSDTLERLESKSWLDVKKIEWAEGKFRREFHAKEKPNTALFSQDELKLLHDIGDYIIEDHTANSISELSHDHIWKMAVLHEAIPYESILVSDLAKIDKNDLEWAKTILE